MRRLFDQIDWGLVKREQCFSDRIRLNKQRAGFACLTQFGLEGVLQAHTIGLAHHFFGRILSQEFLSSCKSLSFESLVDRLPSGLRVELAVIIQGVNKVCEAID